MYWDILCLLIGRDKQARTNIIVLTLNTESKASDREDRTDVKTRPDQDCRQEEAGAPPTCEIHHDGHLHPPGRERTRVVGKYLSRASFLNRKPVGTVREREVCGKTETEREGGS